MKVKFTRNMGCAKIGMIEDYPEAKAKRLIETGAAEGIKETPPKVEEEFPVIRNKSKSFKKTKLGDK